MMKISSIIIADDIACQRNQLQHPLQLLNFKTARFWDERLYFCRTAPADARKNGRCNLFFLTDSQNRADDFIPPYPSGYNKFHQICDNPYVMPPVIS